MATRHGNHFAIIERHSEAAHDLHSGGVFSYRQPFREMLGAELDKVLLPLRIEGEIELIVHVLRGLAPVRAALRGFGPLRIAARCAAARAANASGWLIHQ